jgi:hypothetical protein
MLEYDPNLPQEFSHKPSRVGTSLQIVALALATALLVYILLVLLPLISRLQV